MEKRTEVPRFTSHWPRPRNTECMVFHQLTLIEATYPIVDTAAKHNCSLKKCFFHLFLFCSKILLLNYDLMFTVCLLCQNKALLLLLLSLVIVADTNENTLLIHFQ